MNQTKWKGLIALLLSVALTFGGPGAGYGATAVTADTALKDTAAYLHKTVPQPEIGSSGGEWAVLGLARSDFSIPQAYYDNYYNRIVEKLKADDGVLSTNKYTEYSRVILALTAIGKDPANVANYNLLKALGDYNKVNAQGINGPIFALLALDSGNYDILANLSAATQATREMYVDSILAQQLADGGFNLTGTTSDIDLTAMALQALSKYQERDDVRKVITESLAFLSKNQNSDGGFASWGSLNSESCAQVVVALTEFGIDPGADSRFIKNGHSVIDALLGFYVAGGGFEHLKGRGVNQIATEQGFYALVAYDRFQKGRTSLYDMKGSGAANPGAAVSANLQKNEESLKTLSQATPEQQKAARLPDNTSLIDPAAAATVALQSGDGVSLSVPPGALTSFSAPVRFNIEMGNIATPPQNDPGALVLNPLKFQRTFSLQDTGTAEFKAPVTVTFPLVAQDLPEGVIFDQLAVYAWDPKKQDWLKQGGVYDPENRTISCPVYRFSTYAVMADIADVPERLAGSDRFRTAAEVASQGWKSGAESVVLVNAYTFADALAAVPLAFKRNAPVLLTEARALPAVTAAKLQELKAQRIILIGGEGVISQSIQQELNETYGQDNILRYGGRDRYDTAAKIAEALGTAGQAVVAGGGENNFADALAISGYAAYKGIPILFSAPQTLPAATAQALKDRKVTSALVVGGQSAIADEVLNQLPSPVRYSGQDRYETAAQIAGELKLNPTKVYVATGLSFADALTAANLAARTFSPLVLVGKEVPAVSAGYLAKNQNRITNLIIIGGQGVISGSQEKTVRTK